MKNTLRFGAVAAVGALALVACSSAPEETGATASDSAAATASYKACMVSDAGGFDDASFNQAGYEGLQTVAADLGIQYNSAQSTSDADYAPNIAAMIADGCDLTITVGFLLADATAEAAAANPDSDFAIIDNTYETPIDNVKPLTFETDEAAFLAGYGAAAATKTGIVATFGGMQIPTVTIFMDGFLDGVNYYNEQKGTSVQVLGWDGTNGSFADSFDDTTKGQSLSQGFIDQGADIIMPVAGPVGQGTLAAAKAAGAPGNIWVIGVDSDWTLTQGAVDPDYPSYVLTSVMKQMGPAVYQVVSEAAAGNYSADAYVGTLENDGVGLPGWAEGTLDDATLAEIDTIKAGIIDGSIAP
ncbi:BMP family lipoprotein [Demequina capsici]|uniref:BMP family ABC transporter substrate-binding protein n=1 Tax=Demequina capsici TaxID=3075620 RepID=A0AA96F824_9MICO|nr:BMP family ABC transporter substrate-binding protein [Demequina sp. OYTSA14]WNM25132.1 BMP family ABC transporter substrate-binding protein [Demequina sp. OYTSA14]